MAKRIKMDFEEDDNEELIDFNLVEAAEEIFFGTAGDPLLELTPIVYTTKLDDMHTMKQDVTGLDSTEILKKLHSESRPVINYSNVKKRKMDSRCPSFMRVSRVVSDINSKASEHRKITEKSDKSYDSSQQHERCKPCTVRLNNIDWLVKNQQTIRLSKIAIPKILQKPTVVEITLEELTPEYNNSSNDNIRQTAIKEEIEISVPNKSENGVKIAEAPLKVECIEIDVEPPGKNKNVANEIEKVQGSGWQRGKPKKRPRYICEDSDEDDIPLQAVKKAKLPSSRSSTPTPAVVGTNIDRTTGHSQHTSRIVVTDMVCTPQEKYFLIVLTNKNDESTIYRTNATKFITDYYMTRKNKTDMTSNELVLASLFPREEKIIEKYCCWYRREDIVSKICSRKNFPFIIQKFLKQPHGCIIEDCECCCRIELQKDNTKSKQSWREVVKNNLEDTDAWMKQLLGINATNSDRLLSKTFNYIPKSPKLVDKKTRETQLNNILLCIENYKNRIVDNLSEFELYYIGNNGDVQRTIFSNDREQVQLYRKSYQPISESKGEIKHALTCCWYKREKLMQDLKTLKASPAALRHIQKPHRCARNICSCCCKPTPLKLVITGGNIVPPTLHHTALYEKSDNKVEIDFNKTKSQHSRIKNDVRSQLPNKAKAIKAKDTNATVAAVTLCDSALKEDNLSLSIGSIDKFHTLKLDVSQYGTLEVILDAPAKTLTVQDLKVLSNTITLATNKMSELELTAEEFCTRVNSKSTEPVQIKDFEATVLRSVESAPTEDTADNSDHYDNNDHMDYDDVLVNTNVKVVVKPTTSHSTITNNGLNTSSAPKVTHVSIPILQKPTNPKAGLLSALSGLMQTKSKCYVDSFKSFFKKSARSKKTPEGSENSALQAMQKYSKKVQNDLISLPVIAKTFTLNHSSETELPEARVGSKIYPDRADLSINNTQMYDISNSVDSTVKLRLKPVSELIAPDAPTTDIGNVQRSSSDWAVPIVPNVEPHNAAQKITSNNMAATVGPDMHSPTIPTFVIPQNVPIGTTFKLVRKPLSYTPNHSTTTTSFNKNGTHVLTLMPIGGQPSNGIVPELLPFRPDSATHAPAPTKVYIKKITSLNTNKQIQRNKYN